MPNPLDTQFINYLAAAIEPAVKRVVEETVREVLCAYRLPEAKTASCNQDTEAPTAQTRTLPETGYLRVKQIIGDPQNGEPGLVPVSSATWWKWCSTGKAPPPIKLGPRTTVWRVEDIREFIGRRGVRPRGEGPVELTPMGE